MSAFDYVWIWRHRTVGPPYPVSAPVKVAWFGDGVDRAGRRCRVLAAGSRNSVLIEFEDGYRVVTSRRGLRRAG
ncbi:hypothetical protein ACQP00_24250 [Dactylosporangium sp. CS-047395]|uniref:hypothetical protein n=1 Tax=Dactylosporangium sp. CS-047395 TaxID=3239936 RepID=UPI003D9259AF